MRGRPPMPCSHADIHLGKPPYAIFKKTKGWSETNIRILALVHALAHRLHVARNPVGELHAASDCSHRNAGHTARSLRIVLMPGSLVSSLAILRNVWNGTPLRSDKPRNAGASFS